MPASFLANTKLRRSRVTFLTDFGSWPGVLIFSDASGYFVSRVHGPTRCLSVPFCLQRKQMRIVSVQAHQLLVAPLFDDSPFLDYDDLIRHADRREPVRDENRDSIFRE